MIFLSSCASINGQSFKQNLIDCVKQDSQNVEELNQAIMCMEGLTTNNLVPCLSCIGSSIAWSTEEVECIANVYLMKGK